MQTPTAAALKCAVVLTITAVTALTATTTLPGPGGHHEALLRVARTPGNAWGGESLTLSCERLPFSSAAHGRGPRFWSPIEHRYTLHAANDTAAFQWRWFNEREAAVGDVFDFVLGAAVADDVPSGLVVDVGSNTGWYAMSAAARGYVVLGVDMQPECVRRARCAALMNRVERSVELHTAYVTPDADALPVRANGVVCIGAAGLRWEDDADYGWTRASAVPVQPLHLGRLLAHRLLTPPHQGTAAPGSEPEGRLQHARHVALLKCDIEGGEVALAQSLASTGEEEDEDNGRRDPDAPSQSPRLLELVDNLVIEWQPHMWAALGASVDDGVRAFAPLFAAGLAARHLPDSRHIDAARWRRWRGDGEGASVLPPDGGPAHPPLPALITDVAGLRAYTDEVLRREAAARAGAGVGALYTLWWFRPPVDDFDAAASGSAT